jgi:methionine aminotransferase
MMSDMKLKSKLPGDGDSIFAVMSKMAADTGAINLSQGFPNFKVDQDLIDLVTKAMNEGFNQYAPMPGIFPLRKKLSEHLQQTYGYYYNPESEITITSGATQAIYAAINAVVHEGDEVIIIEPAFDIYRPAVVLNGGIPRFMKMNLKESGFSIDWQQFKKLISPKTSMIIINTPHNPTSSVMSEEDMLNLESLCRNTSITVLSDEVYEHIIFDNLTHQSVSRFPELAKRSFKVGSFGKTFHVTGWKTGYCAAPENMMKEFRKAHQNIVFAGFHPVQKALAEYIDNKDKIRSLPDFYQQKRDRFLYLMKNSRFKAIPSLGTYFQLFSYEGISDKSEMDFAIELTKEMGVATIPLSYFYNDNQDSKLLRVCFAKTDDILQKSAEILCKI